MFTHDLSFRFRLKCQALTEQAWFDFIILVFIASNCITLAMERPNIPPWSTERKILDICNNIFTVVFSIEMFMKVINLGEMQYKEDPDLITFNRPSQPDSSTENTLTSNRVGTSWMGPW